MDCYQNDGPIVSRLEISTLQSARVLLADDDPVMRELASAKLSEAGYRVTTAVDGAEAFRKLEACGADLVISDLDMPHLTGFQLTRKIRDSAALREIPVIVVTASDHGDSVDEAFAAGATSFLAKPINWTLFGQAVLFVLKASRDQKALREARDQAEAGAKFKDSLMSIMSHELRTPLNAIIGFGQLLGEQFERENDHLHREYADYIVDGGKRLLNSVSDMLLASDARSGPIAINEIDCTVGDIVELARQTVEKPAQLAGAELTIAIQNPELEVCCDRQLMCRAVAKLIENSVKFSPKGVKVVVGVALMKSGDLAVLVKDNGPGIAREKLADIAQPFAQTDMSLRRSKEGLGLGIPLVQAVMIAHGGALKIDSKPGEGVKALLVLPSSRVHTSRRAAAAAAIG
jgi:signal transduction histidine kinase